MSFQGIKLVLNLLSTYIYMCVFINVYMDTQIYVCVYCARACLRAYVHAYVREPRVYVFILALTCVLK